MITIVVCGRRPQAVKNCTIYNYYDFSFLPTLIILISLFDKAVTNITVIEKIGGEILDKLQCFHCKIAIRKCECYSKVKSIISLNQWNT